MKSGARTGTLIAGSLVILCVAILVTDYAMADRKPFAARPAAEQKRVTSARLARKSRDNVAAWALIAAAAAFLTFAKGLVKEEKPSAPVERRQAKAPGPLRSRPTAMAPELDLSFVDQAVSKIGRGKEAGIPLLQAIQNHYRYLPDEALRRVCELTDITPAEIAGTSSFYGQFRRSPVGEHVVRVCLGCCSLAPVLMVDGHTAGKLTPATACEALKVTA